MKSESYYFLDGGTEGVCITNSIKTVKEPKIRQLYDEEAEDAVYQAEIPPPDRSQILERDLENNEIKPSIIAMRFQREATQIMMMMMNSNNNDTFYLQLGDVIVYTERVKLIHTN